MVAQGDGGEVTGRLDQIRLHGPITLARGAVAAGTVVQIDRLSHVVVKLCMGYRRDDQAQPDEKYL